MENNNDKGQVTSKLFTEGSLIQNLRTQLETNTYDYGARQYYSILGRWDRVDPLCEKYYSVSPYAYCGNNPVNAIDPDGKEIWIYYNDANGQEQSFQYHIGMNCTVDNSVAQTIVSNLNEMYNNKDGSTVIDAIINCKTKYGYRQADTHSKEGEGYFSPATNIVNLQDVSNTPVFAEETFHIFQAVNNQGGTTSVNEVEARLFSAKMYYEIDRWNNVTYRTDPLDGNADNPYSTSMSNLLFKGYNDMDFKTAVINFFDGSLSGNIYKNKLGYTVGTIKKNPLIKNFLPANF